MNKMDEDLRCPYENQKCGYDSTVPKPCVLSIGMENVYQHPLNAKYCPYAMKF
jgi:hypothetical protein